jgi:HEAT repeat protein
MKNFTAFVTVLILIIILSTTSFAGDNSTKKYERTQNTVSSLIEGLNSDNIGLKTSCAYLLGELNVTEGIIPLMRLLRNDESEEVRICAALALYKIGTPISIFAVKQAIRFDESDRVSRLAAKFYYDFLRSNQRSDAKGEDKRYTVID